MENRFIKSLKELGNVRITNNSDGSILVEPVKEYNESTLKISQRTVVHCETEELADKVLDIAHNLGYKWASGGSFKNDNKYWCNRSDTCYNINAGMQSPLSFYKSSNYKVISAIDFINLHNNERLLNAIEQMLKNCKISNTKAIKKDNGSVLLRCIDYKTDSPLKISPTTVVHCITEKEANFVLRIAHNLGYSWTCGESFLKTNRFVTYKELTCYNLTSGLYDRFGYYNSNSDFTVITAKEFLELHGKYEEFISVKTWDDLNSISGYFIDYDSVAKEANSNNSVSPEDKNIAISEKHCKMMLAIAQISQLMPHYGGEITNKEWCDYCMPKYIIIGVKNNISTDITFQCNSFLAFHTEEQRDSFFDNNKQLVKDFLMID